MTTTKERSAGKSAESGWSSDLDRQAVDHIRALAMDAVQAAGDGHPGTAMSLAPAAYLLFQEFLRHDPTDPDWVGRDRFVLSCGHSSLTLYIQLYLSGYGLTLEDLKLYRQWGSLTPGHPEHGHTIGVEVTTGPLGSGVAASVGMAMAARRERGLYDPDAKVGESVFDHTIWVFVSDGDMEEGVSAEASSLAGHQRLGNLVVIYDDNHISIEGNTDVAFSEDVAARYAAYGWHVQDVADSEDVNALRKALKAAQAETGRPSFIRMRSIIGFPAPHLQNTGKAHGSALGVDEVAATKEVMGLDPHASFSIPDEVVAHAREVVDRGREAHAAWETRYQAWRKGNPKGAELLDRLRARRLPDGWEKALPSYKADAKGMATRAASGEVLSALADVLPELWGGSADLAGSNNTSMKGALSFEADTADDRGPYGRTLHFGIREHAMGMAMNGIALHGGTRPYGGTFLVFSDYMRGSVRLAALMKLPVIYVWTHDSIGLGGDGPTHQPVEHLAALRAIPGLDVVRPADANETVDRLADHARAARSARRPGALPPGRADHRPRRVRKCRGNGEGGVRARRSECRYAEGDPDRHGIRGQPRAQGPRVPRGRRDPHPRRLDAVSRVVPRPGPELPADRPAAERQGPRIGGSGRVAGLARLHRRLRREHLPGALRCQRAVQHHLRAVRHHSGAHRCRGALQPVQGRGHPRLHHR